MSRNSLIRLGYALFSGLSACATLVGVKTPPAPLHLIDPARDGDLQRLRRLYDTLYPRLFPVAEDRESWDQWIDLLRAGPENNLFILAGGEEICGFVTGNYFPASGTGLVGYLGVHPDARRQGLARRMLDHLTAVMATRAQQDKLSLNGVFAEVYDPVRARMIDAGFSAEERLLIYRGWGAKRVPIDYREPCMADLSRKVDDMNLLSVPVAGALAAPDAVSGFIRDYYRSYGYDPATDPDYAATCVQLAHWGGYIDI